MPKLKPIGYKEQDAEFRAKLADHMIRCGMNKGDVAEVMRMQRCATRKYVANPDLITVGQLRRMIKRLNFSREEICEMLF